MADTGHATQGESERPEIISGAAAQAQAIAAANADDSLLEPRSEGAPKIVLPAGTESSTTSHPAGTSPSLAHADTSTSISELDSEDVPPPAYSESHNQINLSQGGLKTSARLQDDGRISIAINDDHSVVSNLLVPALRRSMAYDERHAPTDLPPGYIPPSLGGDGSVPPPPPMNVVIHVVGSRGDVQPFVALGKVLKETYGHRVRLATHAVFKDFVTENGLEFFCIGGDPSELMAFMVKHPGLMPGTEALRDGDIRERRKGMYKIIQGCWRSCYEAGDGVGTAATDSNAQENFEGTHKPFVADAIIANPPSFAHIHCAEKLAIPLHLMFTMPWSPTQAFPHPLANIQKSSAEVSMTNFLSYVLVELMTWQGLGDVINRFREKYLGLEPLSMMWAPALASRLRIPFTYCWSPALIPKPKDWGSHITVSGFYFLNLATNYQPDADLQHFLDAGPPPVYIGFGSIVVDDPNAMTQLIFEAVKLSGQRALVSKGWGGFGSDELRIPENIFMLGNVPHDWLFKRVSCVVHHGGAGTTAAGIAAGRPTVVVPFFGDQPFWGAMTARAGAGPDPIPNKELTAEKLADGIKEALTESCIQSAKEYGESIAHEKGSDLGAKSFHDALDMETMRCSLAPSRVAVWKIKGTNVTLSALAAAVLGEEGRLNFSDLRLHRPKECDAEEAPWEPIGGAASALMGTIGSMMMGVADMPMEIFKAMSKKSSGEETGSEEQAADDNAGEGSSQDARPNASGTERAPSFATSTTDSTSQLQSERGQGQPKSPGGKSPTGQRTPTKPGEPITMETAMDMTRGVGRFTEAGLKSPMDFTLALAKGFRNAPKLYGDDTLRPTTKVTGIQSGLKASAREFGYGMYDGISGLVTQPMEGAKKKGFSGFLKGFGKGIGGIVLKPGAAFWALPGYTFQGIYKEIKKSSGASLQNYIIAARTAQGFEDWGNSNAEERQDIIKRWEAIQEEIERQKKQWYQPYMESLRQKKSEGTGSSQGQSQSRSQTASDTIPQIPPDQLSPGAGSRPENPAEVGTQAQEQSHSQSVPHGEQSEYEDAIRQSVMQTSTGDEDEDAMVERAIRDSLAEFQRQPRQTAEEESQAGALRTDVQHAQGEGEEEDLRRAIEASQEKTREEKDEDLEMARAMYESRKAHDEQRKTQQDEDEMMEYMKKHSLEGKQS